jgi:hypothetical protein
MAIAIPINQAVQKRKISIHMVNFGSHMAIVIPIYHTVQKKGKY